MDLRTFDDINDPDLASAWERLEGAGVCPSLFVSRVWVATWARHFGTSLTPAIVVGYEGEEPVGLAPLFATARGTAEFPVNFLAHRGEFVVGAESADRFAAAVLANLRAGRLRPHLRGIPAGSLTFASIDAHARDAGFLRRDVAGRRSPYVDIETSWDDYLSGRPKKVKHEWERKIRKLGRAGDVAVHRFEPGTPIEPLLDTFIAIEERSWKGDEGTSIAGRGVEAFYLDISLALAEAKSLMPFWVDLDGETIGFIFGAVFGGTYFALKTSYGKAHSKLAPGVQLFYEAVGHAFREGLARFDFVGQTSRWKEEWATGRLDHWDVALYPAGPAGLADYLVESRAKPLLKKIRSKARSDS